MASLEVGWHVRLLTGGKVTDVPGNLKVLQRRTTDEDNSMHITGPTSEFWMTFPTGWRVERKRSPKEMLMGNRVCGSIEEDMLGARRRFEDDASNVHRR